MYVYCYIDNIHIHIYLFKYIYIIIVFTVSKTLRSFVALDTVRGGFRLFGVFACVSVVFCLFVCITLVKDEINLGAYSETIGCPLGIGCVLTE